MDQREMSRKGWNDNCTTDAINSGSFQRIADACELMAKNYTDLINDRDRFERWYREEKRYRHSAERSSSALRGVITKLKNRLNVELETRSSNSQRQTRLKLVIKK